MQILWNLRNVSGLYSVILHLYIICRLLSVILYTHLTNSCPSTAQIIKAYSEVGNSEYL